MISSWYDPLPPKVSDKLEVEQDSLHDTDVVSDPLDLLVVEWHNRLEVARVRHSVEGDSLDDLCLALEESPMVVKATFVGQSGPSDEKLFRSRAIAWLAVSEHDIGVDSFSYSPSHDIWERRDAAVVAHFSKRLAKRRLFH